ncbi:hypothetical protein ACFY04_41170 [Streptomyces sp. NPDC001549]
MSVPQTVVLLGHRVVVLLLVLGPGVERPGQTGLLGAEQRRAAL